MKKLILLLSFMACLCLDGYAKTRYLDLSNAIIMDYAGGNKATWTTQEGVSYTMGLPCGTTKGQWYGIRLGEFSKEDFLSSSSSLDGELVIVSSAQTVSTTPLFQISVWGVYTGTDNKEHETKLKLSESQEDAIFPAKTTEGDGDQKFTINLSTITKQIVNNAAQNVDLSTFTKFYVYLMRNCTADDNSSITIKKVYVHHKTHTGDVVYDPNNGRHYVNINLSNPKLKISEAWSAWGCVSIKGNDENGNMIVHIEPKKKADDTYYTDDFGSPRVLGGLVLDIDGRDFTQVLRVQMNQQGGDINKTYETQGTNTTKENMTSRLLTYLDVAKSNDSTINKNGKFWYSQYDFRYTHYQYESQSVKQMEWTALWPYGKDGTDTHLPTDFKGQDIKVSQFLISYDIFRAEPWHEASLRNAPLYNYNKDSKETTIDDEHYDYTTGIVVQPSTRVYGSTTSVDNRYADVSHVREIRIYATEGMQFTGKFDIGTNPEKDVTVTESTPTSEAYDGKYKGNTDKNDYRLYTLKVPDGAKHLNVIETTKDSKAGTIDNITLYDPESPIDYFISGQMFAMNTSSNPSVDAAKENRLAMNIDATDLRNSDNNKIDLTSANKNCLIYVKDKTQLSNTDNVVVRSSTYPKYTYTADNIVLTDAVKSYMDDNKQDKKVADYHYPFFAPYDIKAAKVTYQGYTGAYGTLCLPFAFTASNITADNGNAPTLYTLTGTTSYDDNRKMTIADATKATKLDANQPAIVVNTNTNGSNISYTVSKDNAVITHTEAADLNITNPEDNKQTDATIDVEKELNSGNLQGVYSMRHPEKESYVLQKQQHDNEVMFHKVVSDTQPMMTQFRAYFTLPPSSPAKASSTIGLRFLQGDQPTGIESAQQSVTTAKVVARYNAIGERITTPVKGLNIMRMSDGTTKKIIVK